MAEGKKKDGEKKKNHFSTTKTFKQQQIMKNIMGY